MNIDLGKKQDLTSYYDEVESDIDKIKLGWNKTSRITEIRIQSTKAIIPTWVLRGTGLRFR